MRTVQAVGISFDIVAFLQRNNGARIHEISAELDLASSTVYHHLNTLLERAYVVRENNVYYPSLEFLNVGGFARDRTVVNRLSKGVVDGLATRTGEQAQFITEENGYGYHVHAATGDNATAIDTRPGKRVYLHTTAAGKAILAFGSEPRTRATLDRRGLPELTASTTTDREPLFAELDRIRERGYAWNDEEHLEGYSGVAVPVRIASRVLGALALGGPVERFNGVQLERDLLDPLREAANELELDVRFHDP